jgi:hypothetical protein
VVRDAERTFVSNMCYITHPEDSVTPDCLWIHITWELKDPHFPVRCPTESSGGFPRSINVFLLILSVVTNAMILELGIKDEYAVGVELEMSPISVILHCRK